MSSLHPQPFREWCECRLAERSKPGNEGIGGMAHLYNVEDLAHDLGIDDRRLYAWRFENTRLDRIRIEEALANAGYWIEDVYSEEELAEEPTPSDPDRRGRFPGSTTRISDLQLRVLHRLHIERRYTIQTIAGLVYEQFRFASPGSASWS